MKKHAKYHEEVVKALAAIGNPRHGEAVGKDRSSRLKYLGVTVPDLRRRVKEGFSFYDLPDEKVLDIWDTLWRTSPYAEVLFAAVEYYSPIVRKHAPANLWPVARHWADRVDNWAHSDALCGIYSRLLEQYPRDVYPQMMEWNRTDDEWLRRISLVSLIQGCGKNSVFLPPGKVLPLVTNCLDDHRYYLQLAVGWVLREMGKVYQDELNEYLTKYGSRMSARAFSRAIERRDKAEREWLREMRNNP